jgi:hypothetical protein
LIDADSYNSIMSLLQEDISIRREILCKYQNKTLEKVVHHTGRILIKDLYGNVFEMLYETIFVFNEFDLINLEAMVFYLFWSKN